MITFLRRLGREGGGAQTFSTQYDTYDVSDDKMVMFRKRLNGSNRQKPLCGDISHDGNHRSPEAGRITEQLQQKAGRDVPLCCSGPAFDQYADRREDPTNQSPGPGKL